MTSFLIEKNTKKSFDEKIAKLAIMPMISTLSILNYADMNSDQDVLGYGILLIILNVGMYVGIPGIVIVTIRKQF